MGFNFQIEEAKRVGQWSRVALIGPSGSGKTYSALKLAAGMTRKNKIIVIDTERGSSSKYADILKDDGLKFDKIELPTFAPGVYKEAVQFCESKGYDVIIVDSWSHAWMGKGGALEMVDRAARNSKSNNTFAAWRDVNPELAEMLDAMLSVKSHLIVTMRTKQEYVMETDERGKISPRKIGLAPVQRQDSEYDFDVTANLDMDNYLTIDKTRLDWLKGTVTKNPGVDLGRKIRDWYEGNDPEPVKLVVEEVATPAVIDSTTKLQRIGGLMKRKGVGIDKVMEQFSVNPREMSAEQHDKLIEWLEAQEVSDNG